MFNTGLALFSMLGWRLGLQAVTGVVFLTFLLGTFYRSASLYHPQRRAILHLKSQKRKIKSKDKDKNKMMDDTPPFFDFTTLKSRYVIWCITQHNILYFRTTTPLLHLFSPALMPWHGIKANLTPTLSVLHNL